MNAIFQNIDNLFNISSESDFNELALEIFKFQAEHNLVYKEFLMYLSINAKEIKGIYEIPFLPISFFKTHKILINNNYQTTFLSSGTTKNTRSKHLIRDLSIYEKSFLKGFQYFYGNPQEYTFLALLPSYIEQGNSSLVYMMQKLIETSTDKRSGFYKQNYNELESLIHQLEKEQKKYLLIGVSYALLDFFEPRSLKIDYGIIMETGGMKGRRKEMIREELHTIIKKKSGVKRVHSEYGMTELLSQSYSKEKGVFKTPPWMKILLRDTTNPLELSFTRKSGLINVIDLANIYSCSFIATDDIGRVLEDGISIQGRFDFSDIRGCNLLVN